MISIAVCDNDIQDLTHMKEFIGTWGGKNNTEIRTCEYSDPFNLLSDINNGISFDIYMLDIVMPEVTGVELGRIIRKRDESALIIFVTSSPEFALDAYGIHAVRYITKPINSGEMFSALDFAYSLLSSRPQNSILIKSFGSATTSVFADNIMYVENDVRNMSYVMKNGQTIIGIRRNMSFEEALEPLSCLSNFVQTHKSYLVNMCFIKQMNTASLIMDNDASIPISRKHLASVRSRYVDFITQGVSSV